MNRSLWLAASLIFAPFFLAGCEDSSTTVTQSPEAKKADDAGQDAMRDFMQSKSKAKPAAK